MNYKKTKNDDKQNSYIYILETKDGNSTIGAVY